MRLSREQRVEARKRGDERAELRARFDGGKSRLGGRGARPVCISFAPHVLGEISVMTAMTAAYRDKGDLTRARLNADETRIRAATLGDDLARADAFMQSAYVDSDFSSHESARDHFAAALALFERLGDPAGVREANRGMALASLELGNYAEALQIAQQSMEIAVASANVADQAREAAQERQRRHQPRRLEDLPFFAHGSPE